MNHEGIELLQNYQLSIFNDGYKLKIDNKLIMKQESNYDYLALGKNHQIQKILSSEQQIIYTTRIQHIIKKRLQQIILILTTRKLYIISQKKKVWGLLSLQNKDYKQKRQSKLQHIQAITTSIKKQSHQFIIHIYQEYDYIFKYIFYYLGNNLFIQVLKYLFRYEKKMELLRQITKYYQKVKMQKMRFYFKHQKQLQNCRFLCSKNENKKHFIRDHLQPNWMDYKDINQDDIQDCRMQLKYSKTNKDVNISHFKPVSQLQYKNGRNYYKELRMCQKYQDIQLFLQFKYCKYLLLPDFIFASRNKLILMTSLTQITLFQFANKIYQLSLTQSKRRTIATFISAQLLLILIDMEKLKLHYQNLTMSNIHLKQTGYIMLQAFKKNIIDYSKLDNYNIASLSGTIEYLPPQIIIMEGTHDKINVWKLGIIMYFLIYGKFPFVGNSAKQVMIKIISTEPQLSNDKYGSMFEKILCKQPYGRPTLSQMKKMQIFEGIDWQLLDKQIPRNETEDLIATTFKSQIICQDIYEII